VIENTDFSDSLEAFPNYAEALIESKGKSNLRKFQWSPKIPRTDFGVLPATCFPKADFWRSFEKLLNMSDGRFAS